MSGSGKEVLGMVGISQDEVGAGTFPDNFRLIKRLSLDLICLVISDALWID